MKFAIVAVTLFVSLCLTKVEAKEVVCYIDTSSGGGYQLLNNIKPNICTMIDLAFAPVDERGTILTARVDNLKEFLKYKGTDVAPKMLLSIGGAADVVSLANFVSFSKTVEGREAFADSCLKTCQEYGLSGIDVDWEFPLAEDKENFVELLKAVKAKLAPAAYLLTIAVGASNWLAVGMGGLDIEAVGNVVDYIKMMSYDFHSNAEWDRAAGLYFNAPMDDASGKDSMTNTINIFSVVPSSKLILGLPLYGIAYVPDVSVTPGSDYKRDWPSTGITPAYSSVCSLKSMTKVAGSAPQWTPYMHSDDLWISYDDPTSVEKKTSLVETHNLGGIMVWSLEKDDQTGNCDECAFPLMRAINKAVGRNVDCSFTLNGASTTASPSTTSSSSTSTMTSTTSGGEGGEMEFCPSPGYFKHENDCNKFYICTDVDKKPLIGQCPAGLFWNNQAKVCDWVCVD